MDYRKDVGDHIIADDTDFTILQRTLEPEADCINCDATRSVIALVAIDARRREWFGILCQACGFGMMEPSEVKYALTA